MDPMLGVQNALDLTAVAVARHHVPDELVEFYYRKFEQLGSSYRQPYVSGKMQVVAMRLADEHLSGCTVSDCQTCVMARDALATLLVELRMMQSQELERRLGRGILSRWRR
jgi:hypothetical protein